MKRFVYQKYSLQNTGPQGNSGNLYDWGVPLANTDFTDILQEQHLRSYRAFYDSLIENDFTPSHHTNNVGIIIKGCQAGVVVSNQFVIDFTDSLVYIDGDFYEPDQTNIFDGPNVYLYPITTSTQSSYIAADKNQPYDKIVVKKFAYSTTMPTGTKFIHFGVDAVLNKGVTTRRIERLMKYNTANANDIFLCDNFGNFEATPNAAPLTATFSGLGRNGTGELWGFESLQIYGGERSITVGNSANDFRGMFLNNGLYGSVGKDLVKLRASEMPLHFHTTSDPVWVDEKSYGQGPNQDAYDTYKHNHEVATAQFGTSYPQSYSAAPSSTQEPDYNNNRMTVVKGKYPYPPIGFNSPELIKYNPDNTNQFLYKTEGVRDYANSNLANHVHSIEINETTPGYTKTDFASQSHENRPSYYVVIYYKKRRKI
jgi:hypothetical protein